MNSSFMLMVLVVVVGIPQLTEAQYPPPPPPHPQCTTYCSRRGDGKTLWQKHNVFYLHDFDYGFFSS